MLNNPEINQCMKFDIKFFPLSVTEDQFWFHNSISLHHSDDIILLFLFSNSNLCSCQNMFQ